MRLYFFVTKTDYVTQLCLTKELNVICSIFLEGIRAN